MLAGISTKPLPVCVGIITHNLKRYIEVNKAIKSAVDVCASDNAVLINFFLPQFQFDFLFYGGLKIERTKFMG